jgi:hypothetical protein
MLKLGLKVSRWLQIYITLLIDIAAEYALAFICLIGSFIRILWNRLDWWSLKPPH